MIRIRLCLASVTLIALSSFVGCGDGRTSAAGSSTPPPADAQVVAIQVDAEGFHPATVKAPPGKNVRLVFTRTTDAGCGKEVVVPDASIREELPKDVAVNVDLVAPAKGELAFSCGMGMMKGAVVVE